MMKISQLLIGLVIVGLFASVFTIYFVNVTKDTGVSFNNESFVAYEQYARLQEQSEDINESLKEIKNTEDPNVLTFATAFVASGWKLIKTTFTSLDIFTTIGTKAVEQSGLGETQASYKTALYLIVFFLFGFTVVSLLIGRDT